MISRLSAYAAFFAVVTTASLAYAATVTYQQPIAQAKAPVIVLERVVVTGHRTPSSN